MKTILERVIEARAASRTVDKLSYDTLSGIQGDIENANRSKRGVLPEKDIQEIVRTNVASMKNAIDKIIEKGGKEEHATFIFDTELKINVLMQFLPTQLTASQIQEIVDANSFANMGEFRKYMKANHDGCFDGQLANKVFNKEPLGFAVLQ